MDLANTALLKDKIKALDGFRGLAIVLVSCYHYLHFFSFGWTGVDLFFVLSGFLITGKLVESLGTEHYFRSFYIKRILRIVPLYYFVLLIFFVFIPLLLPAYASVSFKELLQQQIYYWTFTANIYDALHGWPANVTLIHFWSLACEMQFYLLWPFIIRFFYKRGKSLYILLAVFFLSGMLLRVYMHSLPAVSGIYRYVLLPCRMDTFCAGALLYLFLQQGKIIQYKNLLLVAAMVAMGIILVTMAVMQMPWHFGIGVVSKYGYTLNAVFWAALVGFTLAAGRHSQKSFFSSGLLTWLGKYSYGIYVLHWPVYVIISRQHLFNAGAEDKTWPLAAASFVTTCVCSVASYHLLEKHFLKLKPAG